MTEEKIQELLKSIFNAKYAWNSGSSNYTSFIVNENSRTVIETIIRSFLFDNRDEQKGILEAKVFMYEQIISKSNFAPMIKKSDENENHFENTP